MALETVTHIGDLVAANPGAADPKSQGDDHLRNIKSALLHDFAGFTGAIFVTGVDGGAANAYTLTPANALVAYGSKMLVEFTPNADCTGAATLNVSTLGAKPIISADGVAMAAGDLKSSRAYLAAYDGASFRLISVTTAYVDAVREYASQLAFATALPAQAGNSGKFITTDGATASWAFVPPQSVIRSARTSNTILGVADNATLVDITSGTFSQTFAAVATLGSGWYLWLRNSGTGDVTIDPNGAELIDGLSTYVMYPGECRLVQCDGAALRSIVLTPYRKDFTTSGTYTKPPGYKAHGGLAWNGGNSGRRTNSAATISPGGGGAGCFPFLLPNEIIGATETVTIGAGGLAVTAVAVGNPGGNTTFGSLVTVYANSTYNCGGSLVQNLITTITNAPGCTGFEGGGIAANIAVNSTYGGGSAPDSGFAVGNSIYGGGAGGSLTAAAAVRAPGTSTFGGNGGAASSAGNGTDGTAPGGGGGATQTGTQSGAGARGEFRIWGLV